AGGFDAGERGDWEERAGRRDGARLQREPRRGIDRFEPADEPEDSSDHDRRRRPRPRGPRAERVVRHDRLLDGHTVRAAPDRDPRAELIVSMADGSWVMAYGPWTLCH